MQYSTHVLIQTSFVQAGPGGGCGGHGDAGAGPGDMDLTRRQRDQRKKDIREKVRTSDLNLVKSLIT